MLHLYKTVSRSKRRIISAPSHFSTLTRVPKNRDLTYLKILAHRSERSYGTVVFRIVRGALKLRYLLLGGAIGGGVTLNKKYEEWKEGLPELKWLEDVMPSQEQWGNFSRNLSEISGAFRDTIKLVVDSDLVEKTIERPLSTVPRKSERIAAAGKRRLADISKVQSSQKNQKRGKIDQINLQLPTNSSNDDDIIILPDDVCDKEEPNLEVNVQQNSSLTDLEEELVALLPSKSIFVSGFPKGTTIKAISNHISKKLPLLDTKDMEIVKNTVKGDYASFILKTDRNKTIYDSLIKTSVWHENTILHN
ncbi:OPA1.2 family protein [Megaselia abdita]